MYKKITYNSAFTATAITIFAIAVGVCYIYYKYTVSADEPAEVNINCTDAAAIASQGELKIDKLPTLRLPGAISLITTKCQQIRYKGVALLPDKAVIISYADADAVRLNSLKSQVQATINLDNWGGGVILIPYFILKDNLAAQEGHFFDEGTPVVIPATQVSLADNNPPQIQGDFIANGFCDPEKCIYLFSALSAFTDNKNSDSGIAEIRYRIDEVSATSPDFLQKPDISSGEFYNKAGDQPFYGQKDNLAYIPVKGLKPNTDYVLRAIVIDNAGNTSAVMLPHLFSTNVSVKNVIARGSGDVNGDSVVNEIDADILTQAILNPKDNSLFYNAMTNFAGDMDKDHQLTPLDLELLENEIK